MKQRYQNLPTNLLMTLCIVLLGYLITWPHDVHRQLESRLDVPKNIWVLIAPRLPHADAALHQAAKDQLEQLLQDGILAAESGIISSARNLPVRYISRSMLTLGLVRLIEGELVEGSGYFLGQHGGPHAVGTRLSDGIVTGLAAPLLQSSLNLFDDTGRFASHQNILDIANTSLRFYLQTADTRLLEDVTALVGQYAGTAVRVEPLYLFLLGDSYAVDIRQVRFQQLAAGALLLCLLLALLTRINERWFAEREHLRIERMLGRSRGDYLLRWLRHSMVSWAWGVLAGVGLSMAWVAQRGYLQAALPALVGVAAISTLAALLFTALFLIGASRFPLARSSLDTKPGWLDYLAPVLVGAIITLSVSLLLAQAVTAYQETASSIRGLPPHQLTALTTKTATTAPDATTCAKLSVLACVPFGITGPFLWTADQHRSFVNEPLLETVAQVAETHLQALNIHLSQGRYPQSGAREVAINSAALPMIRRHDPDFDIGSQLRHGYTVVGIIDVPSSPETIHRSLFNAALFVADNAPDFEPRFFLAPNGNSGLILQLAPETDDAALRSQLRRDFEVSFRQEGAYARILTYAFRSSLWRIGAISLGMVVLAALVYYSLARLLLVKKANEISVFRLLGMSSDRLFRRLSVDFLRVSLTAWCLAIVSLVLIGLLTQLPVDALHATTASIISLSLLLALGYGLLAVQLKNFSRQEIATIARRTP
jgi:hypothetical protein